MIEIVPATTAHVLDLAPRLRAADLAEIEAATGCTPEVALLDSVERAMWAETLTIDGRPEAIGGLGARSMLFGPGVPWMMGGDRLTERPRWFLTQSRRQVGRMLERYDTLENYVDARNVPAIRYLDRLGFSIGKAEPWGAKGMPFRPFRMKREGLRVGPSTVAEIQAAPEFEALAGEHVAAGHVAGMPPMRLDWESYRRLEKAGLLHVWSATLAGRLIGCLSITVSVPPRCGVPMAAIETWFVDKAYRKTGAGLKLLKLAESKAAELAGGRLVASAPADSDLAQALPRLGYRETSRVFFKRVAA